MNVGWIRGGETISFHRPHTYFILGVRGSGKSSLLEHLGELYLEEGHSILDLFGSRDGENLAWLKSPWAESKKTLLICGDNVDVEAQWDVKNVSKVKLEDFEKYDILISSSPLYSTPSDEFQQVARLTDLMYKRMSWKRIIYVIVREASNLFYSRLKVADNQTSAKAEMIYLIREARHMGVALGLDTLKYTSIDIDIRAVTDFLIFKSQGIMGFPRDLNWIYGYVEPHATRRMPPENFIILSQSGSLGLGAFPKIQWHKQERENILHSVGIQLEFGDEIQYSKSRGTFTTVGDLEHIEIINAYLDETLSMAKIGKVKGRSSATVKGQIDRHNDAIVRSQFCPICKRAGGNHFLEFAHRTRLIDSIG